MKVILRNTSVFLPSDPVEQLKQSWNSLEFEMYNNKTKHQAECYRQMFKHLCETNSEFNYKIKETTLEEYGFKTFTGIGSII